MPANNVVTDQPADTPSTIELHGIDLIPPGERHGRPRDLFGMWLGTNLNIFYVVNGAVVISMGLSFAQSVLAILVGNLAFFAVGLTSQQGPETGTSTFAVSRASYGPNGGRGLALFNWVTCVGFEASGLALVVLALLAILHKAGVPETTWLKIVLILVAAVVQGVLPLFGHAGIVAIQRRLAWVSTVLFIVMAVLLAPKLHLGHLSKGGAWEGITLAIALVVSGGGLSWANTGSDYSRYLPRGSSKKQIFWYSSLGGFLPAVLLEILGSALASVVDSASDPIAGIPEALPSWVAVPYLLFAVVTLLAVNTINLYSSGLTLQALGLRIARWQCVIVDSVICTALCFLVIFSTRSTTTTPSSLAC
jgi:purine-cytosine permease-like protein